MAEFRKTEEQETEKKTKVIAPKSNYFERELKRVTGGYGTGINIGSRMVRGAIGGLLAKSLGYDFTLTGTLDSLVTEATGPKYVRSPGKNQLILRSPVAVAVFNSIGA